jgi:hypothetical protein
MGGSVLFGAALYGIYGLTRGLLVVPLVKASHKRGYATTSLLLFGQREAAARITGIASIALCTTFVATVVH